VTRGVVITGWLAAAALAGCKGHHDSRRGASPGGELGGPASFADAGLPDANLDRCRAALPQIAARPIAERAQALLDACQPCGDWSPLLQWNTPPADAGPTRTAIEQAMTACQAYCDGNARQRFLGTIDNARGQPTRTPWRLLGEVCKDKVSAQPDTRYMSAPYFALDRIARALGPAGESIEIELPAVSVTGVGLQLPEAANAKPDAGPIVLSVDSSQILIGTLPTAKLSAKGLTVSGDYPGTAVAPAELAGALASKVPDGPITVLAPHALPAQRVLDVIHALPGRAIRIGAQLPSPPGWSLAGTIPISLVDKPNAQILTLAHDAKVDQLAMELWDLATHNVGEVALKL
jgi:hypothetical protein